MIRKLRFESNYLNVVVISILLVATFIALKPSFSFQSIEGFEAYISAAPQSRLFHPTSQTPDLYGAERQPFLQDLLFIAAKFLNVSTLDAFCFVSLLNLMMAVLAVAMLLPGKYGAIRFPVVILSFLSIPGLVSSFYGPSGNSAYAAALPIILLMTQTSKSFIGTIAAAVVTSLAATLRVDFFAVVPAVMIWIFFPYSTQLQLPAITTRLLHCSIYLTTTALSFIGMMCLKGIALSSFLGLAGESWKLAPTISATVTTLSYSFSYASFALVLFSLSYCLYRGPRRSALVSILIFIALVIALNERLNLPRYILLALVALALPVSECLLSLREGMKARTWSLIMCSIFALCYLGIPGLAREIVQTWDGPQTPWRGSTMQSARMWNRYKKERLVIQTVESSLVRNFLESGNRSASIVVTKWETFCTLQYDLLTSYRYQQLSWIPGLSRATPARTAEFHDDHGGVVKLLLFERGRDFKSAEDLMTLPQLDSPSSTTIIISRDSELLTAMQTMSDSKAKLLQLTHLPDHTWMTVMGHPS